MRGNRIPVLVHPEAAFVPQTFANLERDRGSSFQDRPGPSARGDKGSFNACFNVNAWSNVNACFNGQQSRGAQTIVDRIIDQRRVPPE